MKAPSEVIRMGYWLTEARTTLRKQAAPGNEAGSYGGDYVAWAFAYLTAALSAEPDARDALAEHLKNRQMLPSDGLQDIQTACIALAQQVGSPAPIGAELKRIEYQIGTGHQKLARMLSRLKFDPITDDDFAALRDLEGLPGGGGGR